MKHIAQAVAAHGRHGDTELLHVSKDELNALKGLGSLIGRPITTNPHTGLPEAFNWSSLIPAAVGIGGSILTGGAMSPLMAGLLSGAATTAVTGNLQQGLLSGLSGGAMAGLGQGLVGMGTAAAPAATAATPATAATSALGSGISSAASAPANAMGAGAMGSGLSMPGAAGAGMGMQAPASALAPSAAAAPGQFSMQTLGQNITNPDAWSANFGGKNLWSRTIPGGLALATSLGNAMTPSMPNMANSGGSSAPHKTATMQRNYLGPFDSSYVFGGTGGEPQMFSNPVYNFAGGGPVGIAALPGAPGGGHVAGPGDGMSDSVPASIGGRQPARLSTDEFVVPADVVSHLGNGSSTAGSKHLYSMVSRIRAARTGKKAQAPQINPKKMLPA